MLRVHLSHTVPVVAVVKLQSLAIKAAGAEGRAPRRVKLFINRASLGFSEAADFAAVQELELTPEQVEAGEPIVLKWVKPLTTCRDHDAVHTSARLHHAALCSDGCHCDTAARVCAQLKM